MIVRAIMAVWLLAMLAVPAWCLDAGQREEIAARDVYVSDGDTVRVRGETYRLFDFDAPEIGRTSRCEREVKIGYEAKARVVDLVHDAKHLTIERIACSCATSAPEGSPYCNYGRRCGTCA